MIWAELIPFYGVRLRFLAKWKEEIELIKKEEELYGTGGTEALREQPWSGQRIIAEVPRRESSAHAPDRR